MVGQPPLERHIGVRLPGGQPNIFSYPFPRLIGVLALRPIMRENDLRMTCCLRNPIALALVVAITALCPDFLRGLGAATNASSVADDTDEESQTLIATADFNRDGIADVAKIIQQDGKRPSALELLLGRKDGSFGPGVDRMVEVPNPRSVATGDFNGDGNPDLLIGDADGAVVGLFGDGRGNLRFAGEIAHPGSAVSMAVGDFNRDGIPDVAVSDFRGNTVLILLGSGGGSFRTGWSFALPQRGTVYSLTAADFNTDGVADLVITSDREDVYVVMLGNGNGTFTYEPKLSNIPDPYSYCPT
jgi:hypothetical protein